MSVLAHLVTSMMRGEPETTQALAYILRRQASLVRAFVGLLGAAGLSFDPGLVESERSDDGVGRPDLRIFDSDGRLRLLVENKFWAGLTPAQPVEYLKMLPADVPCGLLLVVPTQRVGMILRELRTRCQEQDLGVGQVSGGGGRVKWMPAGTGSLLVTDWRSVVEVLEGAADGHEMRSDVLQFRRLVESLENLEAFPALRPEEVTGVDVPRRMMNYIDLINFVCEGLADDGIAPGNRTGVFDFASFYRPLRREGGNVGWLTLSCNAWLGSGGVSPLWLWLTRDSCSNFDEIEKLFEDVYVSGDYKYIPIRLKLGVERDRVVKDAVEQVCDAFGKMK